VTMRVPRSSSSSVFVDYFQINYGVTLGYSEQISNQDNQGDFNTENGRVFIDLL
jgi:hypothetical protein